ncbi:hypothetical protein M8C21_029580 [Ambrosia artemisiifolia]|uniref:Cysteine-rich receptor-like protein kinase 2 n=1 Tax=Ambrosia artemisiifolia TaxID=4212 RepID=A0AAD5CIT1_AMBAR|nr:hypothetical protein M8C21_029580 [Ambrosia artemisiifolia]
MKKSAYTTSVLIALIIVLQGLARTEGVARDQIVKMTCDQQKEHNQTLFIPNFVNVMGIIGNQMRNSLNGTAVVGTGPDSNYGLAQCYGDLSLQDCVLCYSEARTVLPSCFPNNGARIFLDGCFMRVQNYSFYHEYTGPNDTFVCGNTTRKNTMFQDTVKQAVLNAVTDATTSSDYFARVQLLVASRNESAYVLAQCWRTLSPSSCRACLENASATITKCAPWSEGRVLNTGCFMRYSDTDFFNPIPATSSSSNKGKIIAIVVSVVSSVVVLVVALMIGLYIRKQRYIQKRRKGSYDVKKLSKMLNDSSLNFKYTTVEKATGNWDESNKLGQGGFGTVYKGVLPDGREIAVKRLYFNNKFRAVDFYNEVNMISSVEHRNLVRLLGCSCSGPESILVYEYLPNMSLDRFIFDPTRGKALNWEKRFEIIIEYLAHGQLTEKADVYSFGVLILEVVTGMENNKSKTTEYTDSLVAIAWNHFQQNKVEEIFDPNLMMHIYPNINYQKEAIKVVQVGLLCTQEAPALRPSMSSVLKMLAKDDEPLPLPANPPFIDEKTMELNDITQKSNHYCYSDDSSSIATVDNSHFFPRFFEDYKGPNDSIVCGNTTRKNAMFQQSTKQAAINAVMGALRNNAYFAREEMLVQGTNKSVYVLVECWKTLSPDSCRACLKNASTWISKCLPWSEGRVLNTGCFMRYSDINFLNPIPIASTSSSNTGMIIAIVVSVVSSVVVFVIVLIIAIYVRKRRYVQQKRKGYYDVEKMAKILNDSSLNFKYSAIEKATENWDEANKLGQGGFGTGVLSDGREIAVKRLFFNNKFRAADFYNEVNMISSIEHKNLVRLLGCNCSGPESILVYEYLPNMSLDLFIFDEIKGKELGWERRFEIMIGVAEGLVYLHENSKTRIIHRDIKASNILLDLRLRAKIADFGLARSFQGDKSHISTAIAGTLGYMAPEYLARGQLTEKVDVYSFGVLILEVVTAIENNRSKTTEYTDSIVSTAWKHFKQGTVEKIFDPNLMMHIYPNINFQKDAIRVVHVGLLCTQESPCLRPSMSTTLKMLAKTDEPLPVPSKPPFIDENTMELNSVTQKLLSYCDIDNDSGSIATVSHSHFYPR